METANLLLAVIPILSSALRARREIWKLGPIPSSLSTMVLPGRLLSRLIKNNSSKTKRISSLTCMVWKITRSLLRLSVLQLSKLTLMIRLSMAPTPSSLEPHSTWKTRRSTSCRPQTGSSISLLIRLRLPRRSSRSRVLSSTRSQAMPSSTV